MEGPLARAPAGCVTLEIKPDFSVDHWEEYVIYGYVDWVMAMGGLISIGMTAFFMVASIIPMAFNNSASFGILPLFSVKYRNTQDITGVKEILQRHLEDTRSTKYPCTTEKETFLQQNNKKPCPN